MRERICCLSLACKQTIRDEYTEKASADRYHARFPGALSERYGVFLCNSK